MLYIMLAIIAICFVGMDISLLEYLASLEVVIPGAAWELTA